MHWRSGRRARRQVVAGTLSELTVGMVHAWSFRVLRRLPLLDCERRGRRRGDFAAWGPGLYHHAFGLRDSSILTLRWVPHEALAGES